MDRKWLVSVLCMTLVAACSGVVPLASHHEVYVQQTPTPEVSAEEDEDKKEQEEGGFHILTPLVAPKVTTFGLPSLSPGTFQVKVVAVSAGRLFIRYYENNVQKARWYNFSAGKTFEFTFASNVQNFYAYAEVANNSVRLEYTHTPTPSVENPITRLLRERGLLGGSVHQDGRAFYVDTRKGLTSGRAYVDPAQQKIVAYLEYPLLGAFLEDGGHSVFGVPTRDQFFLLGQVLSYVTTERGTYFYYGSLDKGWFLDSVIAAEYFKAFAQLGAPLKTVSGILLAEKGILRTTTKQVIPHREFSYPVRGIVPVSQQFLGEYQVPKRHTGLDLAVPSGTPVYAIANGEVVAATPDAGPTSWGNVVKIKHYVIAKNGHFIYSQYAHLTSMSVRTGQLVVKGDLIGTSGSTGFSTAPHLHLGIFDGRVSGHGAGYLTDPVTAGYINPVTFLASPSSFFK